MPSFPEPIAAYFDLPADASIDELSKAFADTAVVQDEGKQHTGLAAIRDWRTETMARTPFTARPLSIEARDDGFVVPTQVTGSFPGSPLQLTHHFTLDESRIATLKIG